MSLREAKKLRTRAAMIEVGLALFLDKGFEATSVDEIAEACGVSRRTFFRYFETKESLLFIEQRDRLRRFQLALEKPSPEDSRQRIRRALLELSKEYMEAKGIMLARRQLLDSSRTLSAANLELDAEWEGAIARCLIRSRRGTKAKRRARILAGAIMGVTRAVLQDWFANKARGDLAARGGEALDWLFSAAWEPIES